MDINTNTLSLIVSVLALLVNGFVLFAILWQARTMQRGFFADHERRKKQSTIEYVNSIRGVYNPILIKIKKKYGKDHIINLSEMEQEDKDDIRQLLSIVEHLAVGVHVGVYDISVLGRMSRGYFLNMHKTLAPYIEEAQRNRPTNYCEFVRLCNALEKREVIYDDSGKIRHS